MPGSVAAYAVNRRRLLCCLSGVGAGAWSVMTNAAGCQRGPGPGAGHGLMVPVLASFPADGNALVAPGSLATLLHLLAMGARGDTARVLADGLSDGVCNNSVPVQDRPWRSATSLWLASGSRLVTGYQARAQACCEAEVFVLLASQAAIVNEWVSRATEGRIRRIVDRLPDQLRLLLVNAVHYRAAWLQPFDVADTIKAPFQLVGGRSRQVTLMTRKGQFGWQRFADHACVQLPLADRQMLLEIRLPHDAADPSTLLQAALAPRAAVALPVQAGQLWLPRLMLRSAASLRAALAGAGMAAVFDGARADFSAMLVGGGVAVDDLFQSVTLTVDEFGVEAAAATSAALVGALPLATSGFALRVDRPFLAALRHQRDGMLLALALVRDPAAGT